MRCTSRLTVKGLPSRCVPGDPGVSPCPNSVSDRLAASGTMGCCVMCESCWADYYGMPGRPFDDVLPVAVAATVRYNTPLNEDEAETQRNVESLFGM